MDRKKRREHTVLLIGNILLILSMIIFTWFYARYVSRTQTNNEINDFIRTIESLKIVTKNYVDGEMGYVHDWSEYISNNNMTLDEAMDYLRSTNSNPKRIVHIVDMDNYYAYSSYYENGNNEIETYQLYRQSLGSLDTASVIFKNTMERMFNGNSDNIELLGRYRLQETQSMAVAVGTRVKLVADQGEKYYLLLRVIPVESLKASWIFPTDFSSAEVGIISNTGGYVVPSKSMRSQNFVEYIRSYNYPDDYYEADKVYQSLMYTDSGIMEYENFRGADCLWYYSSFGESSPLMILGMLDKSDLKPIYSSWSIIFLVCGTMLILMFVDGVYLMNMNRRLRATAQAAEQASKAKTQFLSAMSHDIRTPLNAVLGMMELAKNKTYDSKYVDECMTKGLESGKNLLRLINDVLDISRIESGKVVLNNKCLSVVENVADMIEMQRQTIEEKNIMLKISLDKVKHEYVYADQLRLNQIYTNLFSNSVKYTDEGGKIILCLYDEDIPGDDKHTRMIFYLEDNGIGMSEEFQANMYQNFAREVNTQVNSIQGTGLGLSIVKQMVDLMGGTIECKSAPGEGTSFTVTIDMLIADQLDEKKKKTSYDRDVSGMHLLVVEDNELNSEIIEELLETYNITCDHANNGEECLEILKQKKTSYSAILMDINMPVMNGYMATKSIRELPDDELNNIPIIAMTADAFAEDIQRCINAGMNGHVAKPIDMRVLLKYLSKIKNGQN